MNSVLPIASDSSASVQVIPDDTSDSYPPVRPQRLCTWLNLIPVEDYERDKPARILFLDSFATVEKSPDGADQPYRIKFEGHTPMVCVVHICVIFVWYGQDLAHPDRPFPTLFQELYPTQYVTSKPVVFENTHVMDFVENGSDNLHFRHVHLWEYSKIYNHEVSGDTITLEQDTRIHYGRCSFNRWIRLMSYLLPLLELHHDYAYHGPGIAVVGAEGKGAPDPHSVVTMTPEGPNRTRVYVTIALPDTMFPNWLETPYRALTRGKRLCDRFARVMANYIKNEFDVDAVIWNSRRVTPQYNLLRSEQHLQNVIDWGKTFYPPDFSMPPVPAPKTEEERCWVRIDRSDNINGEIKSFRVGDDSVISYRNSAGEIQVRDAYCPHQGAHLGVQGRIEKDCVRCPFHGFYFDGEGNCRGSNVDNTREPLPGLKLKTIPSRTVDGYLEIRI